MYKILNETPVPPSQLAGGEALAPYDSIVAKALAKDRNARFQSAAEFRSALAAVARQAGVTGTDTTVVLRQELMPSPPPRAETPPSGTQLTPITGWDATVLTQFERALASYIGPMARVLVKQSAKRAVDVAGLTKLLAEHIDKPLERTEFTSRVATLTGTAVSATKARSTTLGSGSGTTPTGTGTPLSEATLEFASKTLARHIGPIAKVVVKKASGQAKTREQFFELVADQGPAGVDRAKLISELQRAP
jgi:serine/threonine-protein kinase